MTKNFSEFEKQQISQIDEITQSFQIISKYQSEVFFLDFIIIIITITIINHREFHLLVSLLIN